VDVRDKKINMHHASFKFSKIAPYIYLGTNACCQIDFDKKLLKRGIRADISLEKERLDTPFGIDYFLWLPTKDMFSPSQDKLMAGTLMIDYLVKKKIKLYVHCKNGHGRAPTLVAAYFISRGMEANQAAALVKSKRPEIHLNKKQINGLKKFAHNRLVA